MGVRVYKQIVVGDRLGRLVVLGPSRKKAVYPHFYWRCLCDCGEVRLATDNKLKRGEIRSCGCLRRETASVNGKNRRVHGEAIHGQETPEFLTWNSIVSRTTSPSCANWPRYGAIGVTIHPRWRNSFQAFLADVGRRPSDKHSIDRYPDPFGNYEPGNVRWATAKEQGRNRRNNHRLTINGETLCLSEWEERHGLPKRILSRRIKYGWPLESLFLPPSRSNNISRNAAQSKSESMEPTTTTTAKGA